MAVCLLGGEAETDGAHAVRKENSAFNQFSFYSQYAVLF